MTLQQSLLAAASVTSLCCSPATRQLVQAADPQPPNILSVLCDDIRWNALGCTGHPHIKTPHIDALAAEHQPLVEQLSAQLDQLMQATDIGQDQMPVDEGIKGELPDKAIR